MEPCPVLVKDGNYKDFGQVVQKLVDVIGFYNECRLRHDGLIQYNKEKQ